MSLHRNRKAFTLTELLVVISIMAVLAGLLLPALMNAQDEAKVAKCFNNLKQFGIAIESYRGDYSAEYPFWLSSTHVHEVPEMFVCPMDSSKGAEGSRPDWIIGASQYAETNDMPVASFSTADSGPASREGSINYYFSNFSAGLSGNNRLTEDYRNDILKGEVKGCSYLYEFNREIVSWGLSGSNTGYGWPIAEKPTWLKAKMHESEADGLKERRAFIPVIRCFWHIPDDNGGQIAADAEQTRKNVPALRYDSRVDMCYPTEWWRD